MNELILVKDGVASLTENTADLLYNYEMTLKEIDEKDKALRTAIKEEMEKRGIGRLINEKVTIYYQNEKKNLERFDSKRLREESPDTYDNYVVFDKNIPAHIKIVTK